LIELCSGGHLSTKYDLYLKDKKVAICTEALVTNATFFKATLTEECCQFTEADAINVF
jgi:hypothetical protein